MNTLRRPTFVTSPGPAVRLAALALALTVGIASIAAADDPAPSPKPAPAPPPEPSPVPRPGPRVYPPPQREGLRSGRESMWPAPTADDWKKPCLIPWQRTWDDAVAVAKETQKPILICINMDGEIASEHYAGVRYRQPEIAALYEPYVTVIASVYRHTPRDYDDEGHRIPCPRFGGVTCGEHIALESVIFPKFCDGKRISPRHIMVEPDGKQVFDVYYRNDTASVFQAIKDGIADRPPAPPPIVRSDRPVLERVASREVSDRNAVEKAYQDGDAALRKALLDAAAKHPDAAPVDLLRLGVFGLDADASRSARRTLTKVDTPDATGLVSEALRVPMDAAERDALIATLRKLGASSPLARWLAVVHTGLAGKASTVDPAAWKDGAAAPSTAGVDLGAQIETAKAGAAERAADPAPRLDQAEASLALALEPPEARSADARQAKVDRKALIADARRLAAEAEALGAKGWRVDAVLALAAYHSGYLPEAYDRAAAAAKAVPAGDTSWTSMAVLTVFAESRWKSIKKAVREKLDFPPEWLTDVHAAYAVLERHPLGTEEQVLWHYDMLDWLGAYDQATQVLMRGVTRFKGSDPLHARLREYVLRKRGPEGLEAVYETMRREQGDPAYLRPFAGDAAVAAADALRRALAFDKAREAYGRAIAIYENAAATDAAYAPTAGSDVALALGSRARLEFEGGKDDAALSDLLASFSRSAGTAGKKDGMGITPYETAEALLARLKAVRRDDDAARLEKAMGELDAALRKPEGE